MYEIIIERGECASQDLLKLAVAYRYAYDHYSWNANTNESPFNDDANEEELNLIRKIVQTTIKEYNCLRKNLNMDFSESELESGLFYPSIFKNKAIIEKDQ